jgi:hypothetical protein
MPCSALHWNQTLVVERLRPPDSDPKTTYLSFTDGNSEKSYAAPTSLLTDISPGLEVLISGHITFRRGSTGEYPVFHVDMIEPAATIRTP